MRIGIDLGGTKIEAILLGAQGDILKSLRLPTPQQDYQATLAVIVQLVRQLEVESGFGSDSEEPPLPVGIATPGSVSRLTGRMKNCNSTCLNGQALAEDLESLLAREVRLANDADCFTLSEAQDGAAAAFNSVFGVILGTGVGGGIVINKRLLSGPNSIAGEWGHNPMPVIETGLLAGAVARQCYCGRSNCIETWLSGPALEQSYQQISNRQLAARQIALAAVSSEPLAVQLLDQYCESLAAALAVVINVLDPDAVVLGGGLSNIDCLYEQLPRRWQKYVFTDRCETRLLRASYGDSSGVRGAARLWP